VLALRAETAVTVMAPDESSLSYKPHVVDSPGFPERSCDRLDPLASEFNWRGDRPLLHYGLSRTVVLATGVPRRVSCLLGQRACVLGIAPRSLGVAARRFALDPQALGVWDSEWRLGGGLCASRRYRRPPNVSSPNS